MASALSSLAWFNQKGFWSYTILPSLIPSESFTAHSRQSEKLNHSEAVQRHDHDGLEGASSNITCIHALFCSKQLAKQDHE